MIALTYSIQYTNQEMDRLYESNIIIILFNKPISL